MTPHHDNRYELEHATFIVYTTGHGKVTWDLARDLFEEKFDSDATKLRKAVAVTHTTLPLRDFEKFVYALENSKGLIHAKHESDRIKHYRSLLEWMEKQHPLTSSYEKNK